ncbi:MAG: hypothetical protein DA408_20055 [Bacteroidetes bacterium]|nr:MAG: hypothetical protein C7N36_15765 [Bacteroidota bacterium]PTM08691.1 MAG: hypothetical protein DA408_20055 [Bacteroidota bacterium]
MLLTLKRELKELVGQDKPDEVFRRLLEEVLHNQCEVYNHAILLQAQHNNIKKEEHLGLIDFQEKNLTFNTVSQALIWLIGSLEISDLNENLRRENKKHAHLPRHHIYTCDRVAQNEIVQLHYYENPAQKIRHFYLHGDIHQKIDSLYKRLGYELGGQLHNWQDGNYQSEQNVKFITFKPTVHQIPKLFLINLHKELLAHFGLDTYRDVLSRKLSETLTSNVLKREQDGKAFGEGDFVFILITLDQYNWNERVTPEVVKTFINNFCDCELPPAAPNFFFFYGIEYNKENLTVQASVRKHIAEAEHVEKLPPLTPVSQQDVNEWFSRYELLLPKGKTPEELTAALFPNLTEIDMEEVELKLDELTERHNKGLVPDI